MRACRDDLSRIRGEPMPFDVEEASRLLEKKLTVLAGNAVLPAAMVCLAGTTSREQLLARAVETPAITAGMLTETERNLRGAPLLSREAFPVDRQRAETLFYRLARLAGSCEPHLDASMAVVLAALESGELDLDRAFTRFLAGDDAFFAAFGQRTPQAPRLLNFLVQASLSPQLVAVAEAAYAFFPKDRTWNFGHCPVCASPPLMARLVNREGARALTCSFCQLEYRAKRLMCPYCGEEDPSRLEMFSAPEVPGFAVQVCLRCNSYLKTTDFREFDRPSLPALDDLESLTLDLAAQGRGFVRPVLSAWGF
jgi:FdhE protein